MVVTCEKADGCRRWTWDGAATTDAMLLITENVTTHNGIRRMLFRISSGVTADAISSKSSIARMLNPSCLA
jgi:hypothetical protein